MDIGDHMKRKVDYSSVKSGLIQHFDEMIPFNCFKEKIDWDEVYKWMHDNVPLWVLEI